jgi:hypothetical protein
MSMRHCAPLRLPLFGMTVSPGGAGSRGFQGTRRSSLCALAGTRDSHIRRAMRTQVVADLLRSGELKFDHCAGPCPSTTGSHGAAHVHGHPATPAGIRRQLPTSRRLLAETDNTFENRVGMAGFEPATSCSQSRRANQAALHPVLVTCENSSHDLPSPVSILLRMFTRLFPRSDLGPEGCCGSAKGPRPS